MAALIKEDIAQAARIAELTALRLPLRCDGKKSVGAFEVDGRIVRCFDNDFVTARTISRTPERHADAMPSVGNESE